MTNRVKEAIEQLKAEKRIESNNHNLPESTPILLHLLQHMFNDGKSSKGRSLMKDIVIEYVEQNPGKASHQISKELKIISSAASGGQKYWFSWCILKLLIKENKIKRLGTGRNTKYYPKS